MATKVDDKKLDALMGEIVDCLRVLLERQMNAFEQKNLLPKEKWPEARKGLASAYVSAAEAQSAVMWGNAPKAIKHMEQARQKLREMMAKLERSQTGNQESNL